MTLRQSNPLKMVPTIRKRTDKPNEDPQVQTRIDDTNPAITFTPGPSPYSTQPQQSSWSTVKTPAAFNGSAVATNTTDAQLSFTFPGDSVTLGLLYKAAGLSAKVMLENGSSFPIEVSASEAAASAPGGDKEAAQRKVVHLTGLKCANHTATLAFVPRAGKEGGGDPNQSSLYFDWFSYAAPGSAAACTPTSSSTSPSATATTSGSSAQPQTDDTTSEYIGIGIGAALFGFIIALLIARYFRRQQQRPRTTVDPIDRTFRPTRKLMSDETLTMSLNMTQPPAHPTHSQTVFRPRGVHALPHNESFSSVYTGIRSSHADSPSANAEFPLMPMSAEEHGNDAGHSIGSALLGLEGGTVQRPREVRTSVGKLQYQKARGSPPGDRGLVGGYELQRMPNGSSRKASAKSPRRPKTTSAVERLRNHAAQLDIQRPLSPFDRHRPTTSSGPAPPKQSPGPQARLATAPANSTNRFVRRRSSSVDTRRSSNSADASVGGNEAEKKKNLDVSFEGKVEKTTDSGADMWVSKQRKRRNSMVETPKRPPRSSRRPGTGTGTGEVPSPMGSKPFTV